MIGVLALLCITLMVFVALADALLGIRLRTVDDPIIDEVAHLFATILAVGFTAIMLEYGKLQFAFLGGSILAGLIISYVKEHIDKVGR